MSETLLTLAYASTLGGIGAIALGLFYSVLKTEWPQTYSRSSNELEAHHRRSALNYMLVRAVPLAVVVGAVYRVADAVHPRAASSAALVATVVHLWRSDLRILRSWKGLPPARLAYHALSSVGVVGAAFVGFAAAARYPSLFPAPDELLTALWTATLTALVAAWYLSTTRERNAVSTDLDWVVSDVGERLWGEIPEIARAHDTDPYLMQAIVAAEAIQRPRWFRLLERMWPNTRTYGVAQMRADSPLTDRQSVEWLCKSFAGTYPRRTPYGAVIERYRLENRLENHNSTPAFLHDCLTFLDSLTPRFLASTEHLMADDHLPVVCVYECVRHGSRVRLSGSVYCAESRIYAADAKDRELDSLPLPSMRGRHVWTLEAPLNRDVLTIRVDSPQHDSAQPAPELEINIPAIL